MITINFNQFLTEKRLSLSKVSQETKVSRQGLYLIKYRGTILPDTLKKIEDVYGNLDEYISKSKEIKEHAA